MNYPDDNLGVHSDKATSDQAYMFLLALLQDLGLPVSPRKVEAPCRELTCLGIEFDSCRQQIRIPQVKLQEIISLCADWFHKTYATKRQGKWFTSVNVSNQLGFWSIGCYSYSNRPLNLAG